MTHDGDMTAIPASIDPVVRSPAAERMRLHRERRRRRLRCLMVELRETEIDPLIRKGLLKSETRNDAGAVRAALYVHLERTLGKLGVEFWAMSLLRGHPPFSAPQS
jgi:hypothetical protein